MPNNLSRRQITKVVGGFIAGATCSKLVDGSDLISPAQAQTSGLSIKKLANGAQFILQCAAVDYGREIYLNGITGTGDVNMVETAGPPNTGTRWKVVTLGTNVHAIECMGDIPDPKYLSAQPTNNVFPVVLADNTSANSLWRVYTDGTYEYFRLWNTTGGSDLWLDGRTGGYTVGLAPLERRIYTGTRWNMLFL